MRLPGPAEGFVAMRRLTGCRAWRGILSQRSAGQEQFSSVCRGLGDALRQKYRPARDLKVDTLTMRLNIISYNSGHLKGPFEKGHLQLCPALRLITGINPCITNLLLCANTTVHLQVACRENRKILHPCVSLPNVGHCCSNQRYKSETV